jgi:hypothetical protein
MKSGNARELGDNQSRCIACYLKRPLPVENGTVCIQNMYEGQSLKKKGMPSPYHSVKSTASELTKPRASPEIGVFTSLILECANKMNFYLAVFHTLALFSIPRT